MSCTWEEQEEVGRPAAANGRLGGGMDLLYLCRVTITVLSRSIKLLKFIISPQSASLHV